MSNFVHIIGHIGKDAETRFTPNGMKVTSFSVATNQRVGDQDETIWWRVSGWGDRYEKMAAYLKKGKAISVGGALRKPQTYTDSQGKVQMSPLDIRADYINFVPAGKGDGQGSDRAGSESSYEPAASGMTTFGGQSSNSSDEDNIPF